MQRHGKLARGIFTALLAGALAFASPALAQARDDDHGEGFYLGGYAGISCHEFDTDYSAAEAVGGLHIIF